MKVTILGASPVIPNPGQACTGLLVQSGEAALLVDCGVGVISQLQKYLDFHHLTGVLITHMHSDHCLDLVTLRYALKYAPWDGPNQRMPLFLPPRGHKTLRTLGNLFDEEGHDFFEEEFTIREYDPGETLTTGPFSLTFAPTKHYIPCWAVRIQNGDRVLTFSADTGPDVDLVPLAQDADLFICEAGVSNRAAEPNTWGHLAPDEAGRIARDANAKALVITHIWSGYDRSAMRDAAAAAFGGPTHLAQEGQEYEI